jgi:hypothetical protein
LYGAFVWSRRALNCPNRRLPARAVREPPEEGKRLKQDVLYVDASTTVVRPIVTDDDGMVYRELDFGQVPVGPGVIKKFFLKNTGAVAATMAVSTLDPNGAFILLNGSRPIPAGGAVQMVLCFDPPDVGRFRQTIRVMTNVNEYTVICTGEGIRPKLQISPDIQDLHVGDAVRRGERKTPRWPRSWASFSLL